MIREVVEQHALPGSVPIEEMVEPPFVREADEGGIGDRCRERLTLPLVRITRRRLVRP